MTLEVKRAPTCRGVCRLCGKPIRQGALRLDFRAHAPRWGYRSSPCQYTDGFPPSHISPAISTSSYSPNGSFDG
jgi:hypothetical protein